MDETMMEAARLHTVFTQHVTQSMPQVYGEALTPDICSTVVTK